MPKCKKCKGEMKTAFEHGQKGCPITPIVAAPVAETASVVPTISSQLDKVVSILGSLSSRLDKLENPDFKGPEIKKEDQIAQNLQASLEINKEVKAVDSEVNPKCAYGIHYPSDFGQTPFFDGHGRPVSGSLSPAKRRCMPATPEIRKIVDEVLTPEFNVDILPDPASATFMLSIIVPQKYCIKDEFRYGGVKDVRAKVINNFNSSVEVRDYAQKVKDRVYRDHMAAQLPSPFTVVSMRSDVYAPAVPYTQKQVLV